MQIEEGSAGKKMYPQEMEKERERVMCNQQEMGESGWGVRRRTDVVMRCHVTLASFDLMNKQDDCYEHAVLSLEQFEKNDNISVWFIYIIIKKNIR